MKKFELSTSKAPLEAHIRQKEDAWTKGWERLCAKIENHQDASKEVYERCCQQKMEIEAFEEKISRLRLEARAATSNVDGTAGGGYGMSK